MMIMIVYLKDILIFTQTLEDYYKVVCRVLEILTKHKLFLYPKKYKFDKQQIEYLKLLISQDQVAIDSVEIVRVCNWPTLCKYSWDLPTSITGSSIDFYTQPVLSLTLLLLCQKILFMRKYTLIKYFEYLQPIRRY